MKHKSPRTAKKEALRDNNKDSKKIFAKPPFLSMFYISLLINIISIICVLILSKRLPPQLPLYYGLPEGKEQLTSRLGLLIASFSSLVIVIVNAAISTLLKNEFLRKTLITTGLAVSLLSLITTMEIILLVGAF